MSKKNLVTRLPQILQTQAQKEFFDATFDQLFSPRDTERLESFVGRREGGVFLPGEDVYKSEPTLERAVYQLEPISVSADSSGVESNHLFYDDLLNYLRFRGGDVSVPDRLLSGIYYSFAPPIDADKFVNHPNYVWVKDWSQFPVLPVPGLSRDDIQQGSVDTFTVTDWASSVGVTSGGVEDLVLSSGMVLELNDGTYVVEGVGRSIELISVGSLNQPSLQSPNLDILEDEDYITIERSASNNLWVRSNRWVHRDVIDLCERLRKLIDPDFALPIEFNRSRGSRRPIVEFSRRIELHPVQPVKIVSGRIQTNIPPRFRLFNQDGIPLDDPDEFPNSSFGGSEIFGYRFTTDLDVPVDNFLGRAIVRRGDSLDTDRVGDIEFENYLDVRQQYRRPNSPVQDIPGYYFYRDFDQPLDRRFQTLWKTAQEPTRQRAVRRVVGQSQVELQVTPEATSSGRSILVKLNGSMLGVDRYEITPEGLLTLPPTVQDQDVVEIEVYTRDPIESPWYFEIPSGLANNPFNEDVTTATWNDLARHFITAIGNQTLFRGAAFGGGNNHRDSAKDNSLATLIVQNQSPLLKSMLVVSDPSVDLISSVRLSAREYARYRNKLLKIAQMMIQEGYQPPNVAGESLPAVQWLDECVNRIIKGREYRDAFVDTQMLAWSNLYQQEGFTVRAAQQSRFELNNWIDLTDRRGVMYVYANAQLQREGVDYDITRRTPTIEITFRNPLITETNVVVRLFERMAPAHIPATPAKLGITPVYTPRREIDTSYPVDTEVIVGHDGSRIPTWGDIRDDVLLEFETRIFNGILSRFRVEYDLPVYDAEIRPGARRQTGWTPEQYLNLLKPSFLKWATYNGADFRTNSQYEEGDPWTWNYTGLVVDHDNRELRGSWRAVFLDYYDTISPHLSPWEMLGFSAQPDWWTDTYGPGPWPNTDVMWQDLEQGLIRQGERRSLVAGSIWARPGLVGDFCPVDENGGLKPTPLEVIGHSGFPPDVLARARPWVFGDVGPVEYVWRISEEYPFHLAEAFFMGRPGEFGERLWDPENFRRTWVDREQVVSARNGLFRRSGLEGFWVHGEIDSDGQPVVGSGYPVWISCRLRSMGLDITERFGIPARNLTVKLGHRVAGFTNPATLKAFVGGISTGSESEFLLLPDENVRVSLYTSPPREEYFYGGVLVRALDNGTYQVYGYDALSEQFHYLPRVDSNRNRSFNVGGKPEEFRRWTTGETYQRGQLVRLNQSYYRARETHTVTRFEESKWMRVPQLPTVGGIDVIYRPASGDQELTLDYGSILPDPQSVFDFLIGYGAWQERKGFVFDRVNPETARLDNWFESAQQFLFWAATSWQAGSTITLSPLAQGVKLRVKEGYPVNVERVINGVYSLLDETGVMIDPINTRIEREGRELRITPLLTGQGLYAFRANTAETENIITFDNITRFGDEIYQPLLGSRVPRLALRGDRTRNWTGRLEAGGYLITSSRLVPNPENLVNRFRDFHNTERELDDPAVSAIAKHLIGFEERDYFNNMSILDNSQYLYYRGFIRDKGTVQTVNNIMRAFTVSGGSDDVQVREEWALKMGEYGPLCSETTTEVLLPAQEVNTEAQLVVFPVFSTEPDETQVPPGSILIDDGSGKRGAEWITRPTAISCETPENIWPQQYLEGTKLPNAGFVHLDDVDFSVFGIDQLAGLWDLPEKPEVTEEVSKVHVARTRNDWAVYSFIPDNREIELLSHRGTILYEVDGLFDPELTPDPEPTPPAPQVVYTWAAIDQNLSSCVPVNGPVNQLVDVSCDAQGQGSVLFRCEISDGGEVYRIRYQCILKV